MNILDVDKIEKITGKDKLEDIFELQRKLKEKYDIIEREKGIYVPEKVNIHSCRDQEYLKSLFYRIIAELVEAAETLKNKPWKQSEVMTDVDHLFEELADAFHFYIELCINLGIDADKLYELYFKKQEVNKWRQKTKY
ncbi:MAG: dUTP diphosphatase [Roseiflexus sp.]|uniref:dUTP diphosphatase n=1 Tax=Roseiflexus sp. TaxID=2562120 RepID=UPI0025EF67C9|nr:dUTP diphosphatase [Roseiflexus sp.]MCL6542075.1 dUTP diphosphatase [Roseiflexus sp.]